VLDRQLEASRLRDALLRLERSELVETAPRKPTPLAVPLLVDRLRQTMSSEKLADRVRRMQLELQQDD
jgi:ATP-dependent Lhr-like helicase